MKVVMEEEKLVSLIENAVSKVVRQEMIKLRLQLIPYADDEEMQVINEMFGPREKVPEEDYESFTV